MLHVTALLWALPVLTESSGTTVRASTEAMVEAEAGIHKEVFTTNAVCRQKYCVNPIFPGLEDLGTLEKQQYFCDSYDSAGSAMSFCKGVVNYDVGLPRPPESVTREIPEIVKEQEQLAITMYAYHLAGMGVEPWDEKEPWTSDDDCIQSVWRMTCYTYFPKCDVDSEPGKETSYLRPCGSTCANYIKSCGVTCCDESVQCVFEHERPAPGGDAVLTQGYVAHSGPSSLCTGDSAQHSFGLVLALLAGRGSMRTTLVALFGALAMQLQGCELRVPQHTVGNWRAKEDYLIKNQYIPPGAGPEDAILNSCSLSKLAQTLQCSGRGVCRPWFENNLNNPIMFCECDRDWADPECRTPRRSQVMAYTLSLLLGPFGADLFYMGFPVLGALKLCTLGGFGLWWVLDVIRIGSAPVYAHDFRLAADLPHWAFVITVVMFTFTLGFLIVGCNTFRHIRSKRKEALLLQAEEALHGFDAPAPSGIGGKPGARRSFAPQYGSV
jgi:TM2 domain-containing membrane protein YozV